jgi:hypothetical protein
MPSHMSDIGFRVKESSDFMRFAMQAAEEGEVAVVPDGSYVKWSPGQGIELWGQLDRQQEIIGLNPHYSGQAKLKIALTKRVPSPQGTALDGGFYGWVNPDEGDPPTGEFPVVFDVPDFRCSDALKLPAIVEVQLTAFAHELKGFENESAFDESQSESMKFAVESFIPTGLFVSEGSAERAEAIFTGYILDMSIITNPSTESEFVWVRVRTLGGEIEVVADPGVLSGSLPVGGIVSGSFWLSGRVLNAE